MAEFKLGRIRFVWKGDWSTGTEYYKDDVVQLGGKVYICVIGHTSSPDFFTDLDITPSKWNLVSDGQRWLGDWATSQSYIDSDIVRYGGRLYICRVAHTSAETELDGLESDSDKWELFAEGLDWKGAWQTEFDYKVNDFVKYGGISYVCVNDHVSAATDALGLEDNQSDWEVFNEGFEFENDWTSGYRYKKNDVVKYGAGLWISLNGHTSASDFETDISNWEKFVEGFQYESEWSGLRNYQTGDVVKYGGNQYIAISDNSGEFPSTASSEWQLFSEGLKFVGDWNEDSSQIEYKVGEVVRLGGFTYRCVKDHSNQQPPNEEFWQRLNSGFDWRSEWIDGAEYYEGDVVRFGDNSYVANSYHIADNGVNSPDVADSSEFWSIIAVGTEQSVLTTTGDLVYYSGEAPVRLPIGQDGQILQVSPDLVPEWVFLDFQQDVYYVAEHGEDEPAPIYGKSVDRPWRSIRYATHQIEKGARNPDAKQLLELNRRFIQREVLEWTEEQIANSVAPFDGAFNFDTEKYNRDIGRLVDAVVWDVSHGGNVRSREEALEYINAAEREYIDGQETETAAMINRSLTVIEAVLTQEDPDTIYQIERGDNSTRIVEQYKDSNLEAEEGVYTEIETLVGIVATAVTDDDVDSVPAKVERHTLVRVSTGRYYEVLPIIVPRLCCVMGDELRSTRVEARKSSNATLTPVDDFKYSFEGLARIEQVVGDIVEGATVSATTGNSLVQSQDWPFAETEVVAPQVEKLFRSVRRQIDEKVSLKREAEFTPAYNLATEEFGKSRDLVRKNIEFIKAEGIAFLEDSITDREIRFSKTQFKRELEDVIDAISYDITYGGNWQSVTAGEAIVEIGTLQATTAETNLLISAYNYLNDVTKDVATSTEIVSPLQTDVEQILGVGGTTTSTNRIDSLYTNIVDTITSGEGTVAITFPTVDDADATTVINAINSAKSQIEDDAIAFINLNFPNLEYDTAKCERDVGYILDAAKYDLGLDTNFASIVAAYAYLRQTGEKVLAEQKEASLANFEFLRQRTLQEVPAGTEYDFARTSINETYEWLDDIVFGGASEGNNYQTEDQEVFNAVRQLELNKEFIVEETMAWVDEYFKDTVTDIDTTANTLTVSSTDWLHLYMPIQFTDDSTDVGDAGLSDTETYYVYDIVSATEFKITETEGGSELDLTTAWDGEFTVQKAYAYNKDLCARDVREYIDAVKWDLVWPAQWERTYTGTAGVSDFTIYRPASYKHRLAARYYANSMLGSQEEDMYYLRNATGLRLHTVAGLAGDLGAANEYGTRRPTAGAYASLDPGWGPADERVWITERSPYVQNLTTFGFAAVGQKIDGELHDGGNDSIVSNDFTQVISDGIGAWITNNGRAELVSVFSYYAHVGYLAETGGRIRATNGNNSYGTFGSVAEGVDPEETPVTAVVDNRTQFNATINNVYTDGDKLLSVEFGHAGNEYTEAQIDFFGPGADEEIQEDEFRDDGVFQVRIDEVEEGEAGGSGYVVVSNTAQQGSLTGIFLAATDGRASSAYPGMKIYLIGGAGRGQYGIIDSYLAGTKEATVVKEDGTPGWEHIVPGTEIVAPNSTTTYRIEPRVEIAAPPVSASAVTVPSADYVALDYAETAEIYTSVSATGGAGSGATFDVTRVGSKYYLAINSAGSGYERLDELTIAGTAAGGASTLNDITVTVLSLDPQGAITEFEFAGVAQKGVFVAVPTSGTSAYRSVDGSSWDTVTLASNDTWNDIASGLLDDGSSLFKPDAVVIISEDGTANYSTDGAETWTASVTGLPTTGTKRIAFGNVGIDNNRFVVISDNSRDVAFTVDGGVNWTVTTDALPATGYDILAYGKGLFVAIESGTDNTVYSEDGVTWSAGTGLPGGQWQDLAWGNGRFVALTTGGDVSYSLDGIEWNDAIDTGATTTRRIAYGQGMFAVTTDTTEILYSEYGLEWESETGLPTNYDAIQFGNPDRTGRFIALGDGTTTAGVDFRAGARARGRAGVSNEQVFEIRLLEPGSGYASSPTVTVTDPNNIEDVLTVARIGKGALANPTYISRGTGWSDASAEINDEESNGEADFFQATDQIAVKRLSERPVDGSNVVFDSIPGKFFKLVSTVSFVGDADGSYTAFLRISPALTINEAPEDEDPVTLRIRYSQVRLTGHDFLDIGTGNFSETNYPNEPEYQPEQENETVDSNGGRVFFTSTDQDGNFRVGDLFSVEQSTGVASINADAFNLAGLQELTLGEVTLGGNSASINEFSTDPFFTANSDSVVPTQRAVKSFIEAQIGGGGASLNVNSVTAGDIFVGGNQITTVSGDPINITANIVYRGAVLGVPFAYQYFLR